MHWIIRELHSHPVLLLRLHLLREEPFLCPMPTDRFVPPRHQARRLSRYTVDLLPPPGRLPALREQESALQVLGENR